MELASSCVSSLTFCVLVKWLLQKQNPLNVKFVLVYVFQWLNTIKRQLSIRKLLFVWCYKPKVMSYEQKGCMRDLRELIMIGDSNVWNWVHLFKSCRTNMHVKYATEIRHCFLWHAFLFGHFEKKKPNWVKFFNVPTWVNGCISWMILSMKTFRYHFTVLWICSLCYNYPLINTKSY